jgi:hypothetical protein
VWTYKGVDVFRADLNSSGIRWYARGVRNAPGTLLADSKASMRELITHYQGQETNR